jgi:hypothetical protein
VLQFASVVYNGQVSKGLADHDPHSSEHVNECNKQHTAWTLPGASAPSSRKPLVPTMLPSHAHFSPIIIGFLQLKYLSSLNTLRNHSLGMQINWNSENLIRD